MFTISLSVYILALLIYGFLDYSYRKNRLMESIDIDLFNSAVALKYILPEDLHDRAIDSQAISPAEDKAIANKLTRLIKETGFKYTYTIVKQEEQLFFIASDITADPETSRGTFYFYPYEEADQSFKDAFNTAKPTYKTVSDQWGTVRTVMVPEKSPGGIQFLACADYDISYVQGVLQKNLIRSIITVFFFIFLSVPTIIFYTKLHSEYLTSLQASEERYKTLTELLPIGIFETDDQGKITFANQSAFQMTGQNSGDVAAGISIVDALAPQDHAKALKLYNQVLAGEYADGSEYAIKRKDGSTYHGYINTRPTRDDALPGLIGYIFDLTSLKEAEKALRESEQKFRALVEQSPLGISLIGKDGRYKYVNPRFQEMFGYTLHDCPTGQAWFNLAYPDEAQRQKVLDAWRKTLQSTKTEPTRPFVYAVTCKDGSQKEIHFRPVTMESKDHFVIYEDVTERSEIDRRLQQTQKFEAIGTLAGGIAHDFNNLLMGIQGRASLMTADLDPDHGHLEHTRAIEDYVRSATDLTRQLLGFARGGKYEVRPADINALVRNSVNMFGRTKKEIRIHTKFQDPAPVVQVDRSQIEQVLLNLYINAWQAMPGGGDLYLETRSMMLDENYCQPHQTKPGQYARVSVTDTGIGMDADTKQRIFDPFFTTKKKERGTGLGLASAYGIIKNHGGIIIARSEAGQGTTFNIYLPLSDQMAYEAESKRGKLLKGSETLLLVDDEEMILEVAAAMLESLGYRVGVTASGEKAIDRIQSQRNAIDMVILDLIMPGMDGSAVFDRIREIEPQMPVMLSSGYAIDGQADEIMQRGCDGFIQKPFDLVELSQKVRQILDTAKKSAKKGELL